jgi:hypothetical protein
MRLLQFVVCFASLASAVGNPEPPEAVIGKLNCPDRVIDVAFSPDGRLLAAGYGWNKQGGVRIWRVADRSVVASLVVGTGEHADIRRVAFSPDAKRFAAANWDGDVMVWTVGSWESYKTVLRHRGSPMSLSFSPDSSKLAFSSDNSLDLYDLRSARRTVLVKQVSKTVAGSFGGASFSADGSVLAACRPNEIQFWNVSTGKLEKRWKSGWVGFFCQFSPNGDYLVAGGGGITGEKSVQIWNSANGDSLKEISDFRSGVFAAASSRTGGLLALAGGGYGEGGDLGLRTLKEGKQIGYVSLGEFPIGSLAFSPDDQTLAAGSEDGYVALLDVSRIGGSLLKQQSSPLCGEIRVEGARTYIVPLSKVPPPMRLEFNYAWKLEVADGGGLSDFSGSPVALVDWAIESDAGADRAVVHKFQLLVPRSMSSTVLSNYAVFGDIQNPGWNEGFVAKVYGDGSFVTATNMGTCLAYGSLAKLNTGIDFGSLKTRLVTEGILSVRKNPITSGTDHYRTRFIELVVDGTSELRSDGELVDFSKPDKYPTQKQKDFRRIFEGEDAFLKSLLHAGMAENTN